jgi:hypothetical protein
MGLKLRWGEQSDAQTESATGVELTSKGFSIKTHPVGKSAYGHVLWVHVCEHLIYKNVQLFLPFARDECSENRSLCVHILLLCRLLLPNTVCIRIQLLSKKGSAFFFLSPQG